MQTLFSRLTQRGWTVLPAPKPRGLLPDTVAARYPTLPGAVTGFLAGLDMCRNAADTSWFLTAGDYHAGSGAAFAWNAYEQMALADAEDPDQAAAINSFWDRHFPFMLAVHSDYDYLAVRLMTEGFGCVVHGAAPEWEEPMVIADSFEGLLDALAVAAAMPDPSYPLSLFL